MERLQRITETWEIEIRKCITQQSKSVFESLEKLAESNLQLLKQDSQNWMHV